MHKAKAMRSSWEFVVVGLNFFLFVSHPQLQPVQQIPVVGVMDLKITVTLVGLAPVGMHIEAATMQSVRLCLEHPV